MKKKIIIFLMILIPALIFSQNQEPAIKNVNAEEFKKLINSPEVILLDVRTEREHNHYHISDSEQLNFYDTGFRSRILQLPKDKPILIYCNVGHRSALAARILMDNGYTEVYNLQRGILEWHSAGFPLYVNQAAAPKAEDQLDYAEFHNIVNSEKLVFFDFYAPWCRPCMIMMPMIDSLKDEYAGKINIVKINADASRNLMQQLHVQSIPLLVLFRNGEVIFSHTGMISRQDLERIFNESIESL